MISICTNVSEELRRLDMQSLSKSKFSKIMKYNTKNEGKRRLLFDKYTDLKNKGRPNAKKG